MKGTLIPNTDHISRYAGASKFIDGRVTGAAFMLRESTPPEDNLSVNWMEFLRKNSVVEEISELRCIFSKKMTVGSSARFVKLNE
ncbi:MAG: hypothetical protein OEQ39_22015 [Gammaproteobacteria bacterium]|nr:hypothetical protein [Gammaproteobacteria bacterium]